MNNQSVRMYAPANQPPDFHINFNDSHQKLTGILGPFFFDEKVNEQSYLNLLNDEIIPLMTLL